MKMTKLKTPALALIAALACTGESTRAAIDNYSVDTTFNGNGSALFSEFDPSQGTLTSVQITLTTSDTAQSLIYSAGGGGVVYSGVTYSSGPITVDASFGNGAESVETSVNSLATTIGSGTAASGITYVQNQNTTTPSTQKTFDTGLSSFIGTGNGVVNVTLSAGTGYAQGGGPLINDTLFFGGAVTDSGTIDIEYFYDPSVAAVPEAQHFPAATAGVAGLVGLVALVRQIRRPAA
jgi:hypothetical protein